MWRNEEPEAKLESEQSRPRSARTVERLERVDLNSTQQSRSDLTQLHSSLPSQPEGFQFVNIATLDEINNPKTKRVVRQHVWKHRKKKAKRTAPQPLVFPKTGSPRSMISNVVMKSSMFPVPMNPELHKLVELEHRPWFDNVAVFRQVWFSMILQDEAAFLQHVSTVRYHFGKVHGESEDTALSHASNYYSRAVQSVNKRLVDPVQSNTDQIIGAVVCFLTHSHIVGDKEAYVMHKSGLARMISMRGGIKSLDGNYNLRLMLLWDDVCGGCAFNIRPLYPVPWQFIPALPSDQSMATALLSQIAHTWEAKYEHKSEVLNIMGDMRIMNATIEMREQDIWYDPMFLGLYVNPLICRLLSIDESGHTIDLNASRIVEACKLSGLLYMSKVRLRFMMYHITGPHFEQSLHSLLDDASINWKLFEELEIWVLMTFLVNAVSPRRKVFIGRLARLVEGRGLTWDDLVDIVRGFVWLDGVVLEEMGNLKLALENEVRSMTRQGIKRKQ